jgi:ABC-type transport system substrate-binding protein
VETLDRPAIAKMIGLGKYEPLFQIAASISRVTYKVQPRPYNPQKTGAYPGKTPQRFQNEILAQVTQQDAAAAMQAYLAAVGLEVKLDIADPARFNTKVFREGWSHLAFAQSGINPDGTDLFSHFGPAPLTYMSGTFKKSPEFLAACEAALHTYNNKAEWLTRSAIVKQGGGCDGNPVYRSAHALVMQP